MKKPAQNFENDENDEINDPPSAAKKPTLKVSQIKQKPQISSKPDFGGLKINKQPEPIENQEYDDPQTQF